MGIDGIGDVGGGDAVGVEFFGIEIDDDVALLAAVGVGDLDALDGDELRPDRVDGEVE